MPTSCAVHVHQRAAAVAVVDRGVGLDRGVGRGVAVLVARDLDRPVEGAHDAAGDRRVEAVRRADRHDLLTHVEVAGLPERDRASARRRRSACTSAVSVRGSVPTTSAVVVVPSANDTVTSAGPGSAAPASVTTWSLVRIRPSSVSTTPDPLPPVPPAGHVEGDDGGEHLRRRPARRCRRGRIAESSEASATWSGADVGYHCRCRLHHRRPARTTTPRRPVPHRRRPPARRPAPPLRTHRDADAGSPGAAAVHSGAAAAAGTTAVRRSSCSQRAHPVCEPTETGVQISPEVRARRTPGTAAAASAQPLVGGMVLDRGQACAGGVPGDDEPAVLGGPIATTMAHPRAATVDPREIRRDVSSETSVTWSWSGQGAHALWPRDREPLVAVTRLMTIRPGARAPPSTAPAARA